MGHDTFNKLVASDLGLSADRLISKVFGAC